MNVDHRDQFITFEEENHKYTLCYHSTLSNEKITVLEIIIVIIIITMALLDVRLD